MATKDITRSLDSRARRYAGVHMQQGRVLTDADFNASTDIDLEDMRLTRLGVIGAHGSADDGLRITAPSGAGGQVDFRIGAGTFYLGGHRIERLAEETFRLQTDWLGNPGLPAPAGGAPRFDLVYVTVWMQPLSAVEDAEILEPALGGPETTTRVRPMARVAVAEDIDADTCEEAFARLRERLAEAGYGTLDGEMRLVPDTRFTVGFAPGAGNDDLCSPEVLGGYLGAENRTIRASLLGNDRFIWGFDNAAPLYRVRLEDGGATVRFLTEPKDVAHWPAAGQSVEVIPWGAVLDNGEKLAEEAAPGHFALVDGPYDPDQRTLTLTPATAVPAGFGTEWQARTDAAELQRTRYGLEGPVAPYYFLRVWDRGADVGAEPTLALAPAPVALGTTGLTLEVSGADRRPGDHCMIAARPATPDRVLPWELLVGRAPHGIDRFVAPLALLRWQGGDAEVVHDCRPRFRPLTRLRGCCTVTVGDGELSHGDFDTIQAALDALPPAGGEVCVLPGRYPERVRIEGRRNVTVSGCGSRSLIVPPDAGPGPLLHIVGGSGLRLRGLGFDASLGPAILAEGVVRDGRLQPLVGLRMDALEITSRDASAVDVRFAERVELLNSRIALEELRSDLAQDPASGRAPAVFVLADDVLVAENRIEARTERAIRRPLGGVQIAGGSERVLVRDNLIRGGNGNGITLGHLLETERTNERLFSRDYAAALAVSRVHYAGMTITVRDDGCIDVTPPGSRDDPDEPPPTVLVSGGDLEDVEIRDNRIADMALSGIATPVAFSRSRPVLTSIVGLRVDGNTITGCATLEVPELTRRLRLYLAYGGIAIGAVEIGSITSNHIEANGRSHVEPVCGVWVLSAETLVLSDNRIIDNGPRVDTEQPPKPGTRGGIMVLSAAPHPTAQASATSVKAVRALNTGFAAARSVGLPAVTVHDNLVQQPLGKALVLFGHGHMSVSANHLASQGTTTRSFLEPLVELLQGREETSALEMLYVLIDRLLGTAVTVVNLGFSSELVDALLVSRMLGITGTGAGGKASAGLVQPAQATRGESIAARGVSGAARLLRNGEVLFNDNSVVQSFLDGERSFSLCAGLLLTFDDLSVAGNTFSCQVDFVGDFVVADALAFGWSLRCTSNRFEETLLHSLFSAMTIGLYNVTAHNLGTHCFDIKGLPGLTTDVPNHTLAQLVNPFACGGCLQPPFDRVAKTARDANGATVTPELRTVFGYEGLWFGDSLDVDLGLEVDAVTVAVVGNDTSMRVEAIAVDGSLREADVPSSDSEASVTLTGARLRTVRVLGGSGRAIVTRLCTSRPSALPGGDAGRFNAIRLRG